MWCCFLSDDFGLSPKLTLNSYKILYYNVITAQEAVQTRRNFRQTDVQTLEQRRRTKLRGCRNRCAPRTRLQGAGPCKVRPQRLPGSQIQVSKINCRFYSQSDIL